MAASGYYVAESDSREGLENEVTLMLRSGKWKLVGGVSVVHHPFTSELGSNLRFYQALTQGGKHA